VTYEYRLHALRNVIRGKASKQLICKTMKKWNAHRQIYNMLLDGILTVRFCPKGNQRR
jgi:hypothetical protein